MWAYLILFAYPALAANGVSFVTRRGRHWSLPLVGYAIIFVLLVGLRHDVGGDWGNYVLAVEWAEHMSLFEYLAEGWDPGYAALNWMAAQLGLGVYFVNVVCAVFFWTALVRFARERTSPWLAITVAIPYLITVVLMGYSRQGVAIGFVLLALTALEHKKLPRFFAWILVAALFHKTAVILAPIAMFSTARGRWSRLFWTTCFTALAAGLFLAERVETMYADYTTSSYESSGAMVRIATNALPALIYLAFRKRFIVTDAARVTWTFMALSSLVFVPLLFAPLSSTILDRLALYWIPLQLFVLSELPAAFPRRDAPSPGMRFTVLGYSFALLVGWLAFAEHAEYWLTYEFLPLLAL